MLSKTYCAACLGVDAYTITVEVMVTTGISFHLVGLPDSAVRESQQRIGTALQTIGCRIPGKKIVINLAPADIRKEGSSLDLAIAVGILSASGQYTFAEPEQFILAGELALDGSLRPVAGALSIAEHAKKCGFRGCIFPMSSAMEAAEIAEIEIYGAGNIDDVVSILINDGTIEPLPEPISASFERERHFEVDFCDIKGQASAKRALEVAAAGGHNIIMTGPPGAGKSLLAKSLPSILPLMNRHEAFETSKVYSVANKGLRDGLIWERPFRSPHHSASVHSITGGGTNSVPGEISLAHNGILFLDEIAEFPRSVTESLRQPLEERFISISRLKHRIMYPASFMLVASMNPCPCGFYGSDRDKCSCSAWQINRYLARISGPLLDRIDLRIEVNNVNAAVLGADETPERSSSVRERVTAAREVQKRRFNSSGDNLLNTNSQMGVRQIKKFCMVTTSGRALLTNAAEKLNLSARAYSRVLKVARTIADLEGEELISPSHIAEAIQYRGTEF